MRTREESEEGCAFWGGLAGVIAPPTHGAGLPAGLASRCEGGIEETCTEPLQAAHQPPGLR